VSPAHSSQITMQENDPAGYEIDHGREIVGERQTKWYLRNGRSFTLSNEYEPTEWNHETQTMGRRRKFEPFHDSSPSQDKA
jgi:hypothetical protein